jgi:hypothetical protein
MNSLELFVKNKTKSGAVHLELKSSGDELGILYLSEEEYEKIISILRVGCFNKEVDFLINDPYNSDEETEEDSDSFFSIN